MNKKPTQLDYWRRLPLFAKIIVVILVVAFVVYVFSIYFESEHNGKEFYKKGFSSTVVKKEDWQGRANEYVLGNGLSITIYYSADSTLKIGDSIQKKANSYGYNVYRKNDDGKYEFYGGFSINRLISDSSDDKGIFNK